MDAFVVSALKYRPTTFSEVVGQESITQTLENSLKTNQIAQALLFCGPRGVGKTSCARILAKQINSSDASSTEDFAFNIFELDAASNNSVEDIRKINEQVRIPPQVGSHKIYIIDEAHMLSNAAFNAFLKTLEEPPKHAIFILATTEKNKIIPTVLSRCQVYDFKRISVQEIQAYLAKIASKRELQFEENALYLIAQKAEGALRDALSIFDRMVSFTQGNLSATAVADNLNLLDHQTYAALGKLIFQNDIPQLLTSYDDLVKRGIDSMQFINGLGDHFRNLMLAKDPKTVALMEVGESIKEAYQKDTETLTSDYLLDAIALINTCETHFKSVKNRRVHVELTLMQLASLHFNGEKKKGYIIPASELSRKTNPQSLQNTASPLIENTAKDEVEQNEAELPKIEEKEKTLPQVVESSPETSNTVVQESDPKPYQTPNTKAPVSNFSLSSVALKKAASKVVQKKIPEDAKPKDPFELQDLKALWTEYIDQLKKEKKLNIASILSMNNLEVEDSNQILFTVANEMNKAEVNQEMEHLLPFLRKRLNNYEIQIKLIVSEITKEETVSSPTEKYQYLLKLNPALEDLKNKFDLDF